MVGQVAARKRWLFVKFLKAGGAGPFSYWKWPLPQDGKPGAWTPVVPVLQHCRKGYHATAPRFAADWVSQHAFVLEYDRQPFNAERKVNGNRARLLCEIKVNITKYGYATPTAARLNREIAAAAKKFPWSPPKGWRKGLKPSKEVKLR